jgi:hypothetical protein
MSSRCRLCRPCRSSTTRPTKSVVRAAELSSSFSLALLFFAFVDVALSSSLSSTSSRFFFFAFVDVVALFLLRFRRRRRAFSSRFFFALFALLRLGLRPAACVFFLIVVELLTFSRFDLSPSAGPGEALARLPRTPRAFLGRRHRQSDPGAAANWPADPVVAGCGRSGSFACSLLSRAGGVRS